MKHKDNVWGLMLAVDFFFAGMGGGMLLVAGLVDLFLGQGRTSFFAHIAGPVFIGIGACFLILELGRPFQAWRVFLNPKATLTVGAWMMLLAIVCGIIYASFGIDVLPWSGWALPRQILAIICIITGLVVATYPGFLLGTNKARPFWSGPGIIGLFMTSSLATGLAGHSLSAMIWPAASSEVLANLHWLIAGLLGLQFLLWIGFIWVKRSYATTREARAVESWTRGSQALAFWGGFILFGTLLPLILHLLPAVFTWIVGNVLILLGGALMRWMVVKAGQERTWLPGEEIYRAGLPQGDEAFLKAWDYE